MCEAGSPAAASAGVKRRKPFAGGDGGPGRHLGPAGPARVGIYDQIALRGHFPRCPFPPSLPAWNAAGGRLPPGEGMAASAPVAPGSGPCVCPHCCFLPWRGASPARSPGKGPFRVRPSEAAWGSARRGPGLTGTAQSQNVRAPGRRPLAAGSRSPGTPGCWMCRREAAEPVSPFPV